MAEDLITLPYVTVQPDFRTVISDVRDGVVEQDDFWLSCYRCGVNSVHSKVAVSRGGQMQGRDGVEFLAVSSGNYEVSCPGLGIASIIVRASRQTFVPPVGPPHPEITAFDIAPDGSAAAVAHASGALYLHPIGPTASAAKSQLESDVIATSLKFFPSSVVLLLSTTLFELRIVSASPSDFGSTPRILKGHRRGVTDTAIVSKGRNVLSCGKDGTVRLWDVGGATQIRALGTVGYAPAMKIAFGTAIPGHSRPANVTENEVDTVGKSVVCALGDGSFEVFDLGSKESVYHSGTHGPALHAIAYNPERFQVATGARDGIVAVYDTRQLSGAALFRIRRNSACIEDLVFSPEGNLTMATEDGLVFSVSEAEVHEEFIGTDCDAVRVVRHTEGSVWTGAVDGVLRRY